MKMGELQKHDWEKVSDALYALMADTEENEPHAVNLIAALETVIASLPENE